MSDMGCMSIMGCEWELLVKSVRLLRTDVLARVAFMVHGCRYPCRGLGHPGFVKRAFFGWLRAVTLCDDFLEGMWGGRQ